MRRAARSAMAANLIGLVALPLIDQLAWLDRAVIVVAMLLCVLVARACGALLPYLAELAITTDAPAGWRTVLQTCARPADDRGWEGILLRACRRDRLVGRSRDLKLADAGPDSR